MHRDPEVAGPLALQRMRSAPVMAIPSPFA